jgi:hypothetical protein
MTELLQLVVAALAGWCLRHWGGPGRAVPPPALPPHVLDLLQRLHAEYQKQEAALLLHKLTDPKPE